MSENIILEILGDIRHEVYFAINDDETLEKWTTNFMRRFFISQFKRSCSPDGVKVGTVGLSPRGDYIMPSDADFSQCL